MLKGYLTPNFEIKYNSQLGAYNNHLHRKQWGLHSPSIFEKNIPEFS